MQKCWFWSTLAFDGKFIILAVHFLYRCLKTSIFAKLHIFRYLLGISNNFVRKITYGKTVLFVDFTEISPVELIHGISCKWIDFRMHLRRDFILNEKSEELHPIASKGKLEPKPREKKKRYLWGSTREKWEKLANSSKLENPFQIWVKACYMSLSDE